MGKLRYFADEEVLTAATWCNQFRILGRTCFPKLIYQLDTLVILHHVSSSRKYSQNIIDKFRARGFFGLAFSVSGRKHMHNPNMPPNAIFTSYKAEQIAQEDCPNPLTLEDLSGDAEGAQKLRELRASTFQQRFEEDGRSSRRNKQNSLLFCFFSEVEVEFSCRSCRCLELKIFTFSTSRKAWSLQLVLFSSFHPIPRQSVKRGSERGGIYPWFSGSGWIYPDFTKFERDQLAFWKCMALWITAGIHAETSRLEVSDSAKALRGPLIVQPEEKGDHLVYCTCHDLATPWRWMISRNSPKSVVTKAMPNAQLSVSRHLSPTG